MKRTPGTVAFSMGAAGQDRAAEGDVEGFGHALRLCETPYEYEPFPPYYEVYTWGGGLGDRLTGSFKWNSTSTVAYDSRDGVQFRADHYPWTAGQTTVTVRYNFHSYSIAVIAGLSYAFADMNTRILIADDHGAWVQDCPAESVRYVWAVIGGPTEYGSLVFDRSCTYSNQAGRLYSAVAIVEGHTVAGGLSQAHSNGYGVVESIRALTCYDR